MSRNPFIYEAGQSNFTELVIANSGKGPVVVNYWAPWAGPCLKLWPVLEQLAREYAGRFLLVNINTDREKQLARQQGINSLPTIQIFVRGKVAHEIHGAESETSLRKTLDRFVATPVDVAMSENVRLYQQGHVEQALASLKDLQAQNPQHRRLLLTYAKLLFKEGRYEQVIAALRQLPEDEQETGEAEQLITHSSFVSVARQAPPVPDLEKMIADNPADAEARYVLSAVRLLDDDYEAALAQLLESIRLDPDCCDGAPRKGLIAICNLLGRDNPLARQYRARLLEVLG